MTRPDETYELLASRFRPVFARIAEGAVARELNRTLAHEAVTLLRDAGFGAVRVPAEYGGSGASITDLFRLLIELGEADSNLPQILRAHFGIAEERLHDPDPARRERWLRRIGAGAIIGNAVTETGHGAVGAVATTIDDEHADGWRITGAKHYSTGSLYADWIAVLASRGEEGQGFAMVRADDPGLSRIDDWDGFGQRLTASGTTLLNGVTTQPEDVFWYADRGPNYMIAFYQLVHLATLSGIARAIVTDATAYVRARQRVFSHGSGDTPAGDPLVQQVIGRLSGLSFAAEATTLAAVGRLEHVNRLRAHGEVPQTAYDDAEVTTSRAYITVADTVLRAANLLFETGGASVVRRTEALDRHWRNARTLAVHNPVIYKERAVGDHLLNDAAPSYSWTVGVKP
ncbi:acyl-CoA dehydrogenase family protein [Dactylosporangium sp. NPDC051485]|uniref:acyl-CoA dehydrogenase family protein n=1 Tax=Dactylosporangium sp. NPDC051485 TaxID=3154846 RepID=UPI003435075A